VARHYPVVIEPQQVDGGLRVAGVADVERGPTGIRVDVMGPGSARGDELITDATGIGDVGLASTVHVADRAASHNEVGLPELIGLSRHPPPARDLAQDPRLELGGVGRSCVH
jgi:hypothetical protein